MEIVEAKLEAGYDYETFIIYITQFQTQVKWDCRNNHHLGAAQLP